MGQKENLSASGLAFRDLNRTSVMLADGDKPVLVYNHGVITNPRVTEADKRRKRACYIHPLWGLGGEVLTDDFPDDHYHHHGVFWAWPHVEVDGNAFDLWTQRDIEQRFVRWLCRRAGPMAAVLAVENGWYVGRRKVMAERVWLNAHPASRGTWAIDLDLFFVAVDKPVTLRGAERKGYGGLAVRFAVRSGGIPDITVPGGQSKNDLLDASLPWADLTYRFAGSSGPSGAAVFVGASDPDDPPTWVVRHYGLMCVGWPGVADRTLQPGKPLHLRYRIWIHIGTVEANDIQRAGDAYTLSTKTRFE